MTIRGYDTTNSQRGWVCDTCFLVTTSRQFTAEEHTVRTASRWFILAMIKGYFSARSMTASLRAAPGERAEKGWS